MFVAIISFFKLLCTIESQIWLYFRIYVGVLVKHKEVCRCLFVSGAK